MACLRIFDLNEGFREWPLSQKRVILGRDAAVADLLLDDPGVSRSHAMLFLEHDVWTLRDLQSAGGTFLNGQEVTTARLSDADNIRVGSTSMDFFSVGERDAHAGAAAEEPEKRFRVLPPGIGLNCRQLFVEAERTFRTGDTVQIGRGGIMFHNPFGPDCDTGVLELEFVWPGGVRRIILGEIIEPYLDKLCVKLHRLTRDKYEHLLARARRGSWVAVCRLQ